MRERTLVLLSFGAFLVFLALAALVKFDTSLANSELQASLWANHLQVGEPLNSMLVGASLYGREYFWIGLVAVMFLLGDKRTKLVALGLCGVFVVGIAAGEVAKEAVARSRPGAFLAHCQCSAASVPVVRIPLETDYSFPSGHAVIVSIGAVYSLAALRRKWVATLLLLEAFMVCFSRVYTFEHYPTDVVAGFAIGTAIALAGLALERRYLRSLGEALVKPFRDGPLKL